MPQYSSDKAKLELKEKSALFCVAVEGNVINFKRNIFSEKMYGRFS